MNPRLPTGDGEVNLYNLTNSTAWTPRVYFVNGMRTLPRVHAVIASYLSLVLERPVWGVYNKTSGLTTGYVVDGLQSLGDYTQNAFARLGSRNHLGKKPRLPEPKIEEFLANLEKNYHIWNKATPALLRQLVAHRGERQFIVAHSQGNLITSNALFVMEDVLGSDSLHNVRVFSLASPSPGWPVGLRTDYYGANGRGGGRQDNAYMNDKVALLRPQNLATKVGINGFQNAGDFRPRPSTSGADPHSVQLLIDNTNFIASIRHDLGYLKELTPNTLQQKYEHAEKAFPNFK